MIQHSFTVVNDSLNFPEPIVPHHPRPELDAEKHQTSHRAGKSDVFEVRCSAELLVRSSADH